MARKQASDPYGPAVFVDCDGCGRPVMYDRDITQSHYQVADVRLASVAEVVLAFAAGRGVYRREGFLSGEAASWLSPTNPAAVLYDVRRGYVGAFALAHECPRFPRGHREPIR